MYCRGCNSSLNSTESGNQFISKRRVSRGNMLFCIFGKQALIASKAEQLLKSSLSFSLMVHIIGNIKFALAFIPLVFPNTGPSSANTAWMFKV